MKEQAIAKIHKIGHAGQIITLICKILLIMGLVAAVTGAIFLTRIPAGFMTVEIDGDAVLNFDLSTFGVSMQDEVKESISKWSSGGNWTIHGATFSMDKAEVTDTGFLFRGGAVGQVFDLHRIGVIVLCACIVIVCALVTAFFAGALCKSLRYCVSPFEENVIRKIRNLAFSLIPWTVVSTIADGMGNSLFPESRPTIGINLGMVVVVLIVFALASIFRYGAMLQQESDETL